MPKYNKTETDTENKLVVSGEGEGPDRSRRLRGTN